MCVGLVPGNPGSGISRESRLFFNPEIPGNFCRESRENLDIDKLRFWDNLAKKSTKIWIFWINFVDFCNFSENCHQRVHLLIWLNHWLNDLIKAITVTVQKNAVKAAIGHLLKSNAKKLSDIFINPSNFVYLLNK